VEDARRDIGELEVLVQEQRAILQELEETLAQRRAALRRLRKTVPQPEIAAARTARIARGRIRRAAREGRRGTAALWITPPAAGVSDGTVADLMDARNMQWRRAEEVVNALRDGQTGAARALLDEILDTEVGMQAAAAALPVKGPWLSLLADMSSGSDEVIRSARAARQAIESGHPEDADIAGVLTGQTDWLRAWRVVAQVIPQS